MANRPNCQIQIAHDVLHALVVGEVEVGVDPESMRSLHAAHDAISWVLGFPCGEAFANNLRSIMAAASARGYVLTTEKPPSNGHK